MSDDIKAAADHTLVVEVPDCANQALPMETIVGPPQLLKGESEPAYRALFWEVHAAVAPKDAIEELWVHDIVELVWENLRLRRLKVGRMNALAQGEAQTALARLVSDEPQYSVGSLYLGGRTTGNGLAAKWARGEPAAVKRGDTLLAKAGVDNEEVMTHTLSANLKTMDRIDHMIMQGELRRNAILREIDRRREAAGRRLRDVIEDITDVDSDGWPTGGRNQSP
jgi:hypothetical protein